MPESPAVISALPGTFSLPPLYMSRDDMVAFARAFDPQPFHLDEDAAKDSLLGELVASAWYTCARITECVEAVVGEHGLDARLAGVDQILLVAPVRAGDWLSGRVRPGALEVCACGETTCQGRVDVENQRGELVMRLILDLIIGHSADASAIGSQDCRLRRPRPVRVQRNPREDVIRFFEEIDIGDEAVLGTYTFDKSNVEMFRALTLSQPKRPGGMAGAGQQTVPNWHVPAAWMECMMRYYEDESGRFAARGQAIPRLGPAAGVKHLRWMRQVRIGESLLFRGWAERKMEISSQKDWGLLVVGAEGVDSLGNVVTSFCSQMLIERTRAAA